MIDLIKFIALAEVAVERLEPHPDALSMPASKDDRAALDASIDCVGVLEPIMVVKSGENDYLIIDGIGRWQSMRDADVKIVPCVLVECEQVRTFVAHKNAMGRKRSTGSRILSYVMGNYNVITVAISRGANVKTHWSCSSIAERLHVSKQDVLLAVDLMRCTDDGVSPHGTMLESGGIHLLTKIFNAVLCAELPIRRWKAAFYGAEKGTQPGTSGKAQADYKEICFRGFSHLQSAWKNWGSVPDDQVPMLKNQFRITIAEAPQCMRYEFADAINGTWSNAERKELIKQIKTGI